MNLMISTNVSLDQYGRQSKYRHLYDLIEKNINAEEWVIIGDFYNVREAGNAGKAIARHFENLEVKLRKYNESGQLDPKLYIRKR